MSRNVAIWAGLIMANSPEILEILERYGAVSREVKQVAPPKEVVAARISAAEEKRKRRAERNARLRPIKGCYDRN